MTRDFNANPPVLATMQAADLSQISVEYLRKMVREGRIPAHRFLGGREIRVNGAVE
jgi:excisionase family DNA binding protein